MFGGMFKNYREFLIEPTEENPDPPELFDFDRFLEESGLFDELVRFFLILVVEMDD